MPKRLNFLYSSLPSATGLDRIEILEEIDQIEEAQKMTWFKKKVTL